MKLTTTTQVSVDGVMQGPGGPDEDERGVFERGGWAHFDNEAGTVMDEIYQRADAFLFGRRTYEIFADSWGTWDDPGDSPIWTALNTKPKYVASTGVTIQRLPAHRPPAACNRHHVTQMPQSVRVDIPREVSAKLNPD